LDVSIVARFPPLRKQNRISKRQKPQITRAKSASRPCFNLPALVPTLAAQHIGVVDPSNEVVPMGNTPLVCHILDSKPDFLSLPFSLPTCLEGGLFAAPIVCVIAPVWDGNWD